MKTTILSVLRSIGAVIAGFAVIVVGTVLTFEVLVPDFGYASGLAVLVIGTLGALVSGFGGGLVAGRLAAHHPLRHAAGLAIPIGLDTVRNRPESTNSINSMAKAIMASAEESSSRNPRGGMPSA